MVELQEPAFCPAGHSPSFQTRRSRLPARPFLLSARSSRGVPGAGHTIDCGFPGLLPCRNLGTRAGPVASAPRKGLECPLSWTAPHTPPSSPAVQGSQSRPCDQDVRTGPAGRSLGEQWPLGPHNGDHPRVVNVLQGSAEPLQLAHQGGPSPKDMRGLLTGGPRKPGSPCRKQAEHEAPALSISQQWRIRGATEKVLGWGLCPGQHMEYRPQERKDVGNNLAPSGS